MLTMGKMKFNNSLKGSGNQWVYSGQTSEAESIEALYELKQQLTKNIKLRNNNLVDGYRQV